MGHPKSLHFLLHLGAFPQILLALITFEFDVPFGKWPFNLKTFSSSWFFPPRPSVTYSILSFSGRPFWPLSGRIMTTSNGTLDPPSTYSLGKNPVLWLVMKRWEPSRDVRKPDIILALRQKQALGVEGTTEQSDGEGRRVSLGTIPGQACLWV